jgi:hypothetical protein
MLLVKLWAKKMNDIEKALEDYKIASAKLACGSSSCPHSRDKGGQMFNGPCRCYPIEHPMRQYVFAASRLAKLVRDNQKNT